MRIELINGQYRMLPSAAPPAARKTGSCCDEVAPVKPALPVRRQVEEDRLEMQGVTISRPVDRAQSPARAVTSAGVDDRLIAGRVAQDIDLPDAGVRNGLLDRAYFVTPAQLAAFNAAHVGRAVDVRA